MDNDAHTLGATWPDVAIAVVAFAREEPLTFVPVFIVVCLGLWFLFPRVTSAMRARVKNALAERRRNGAHTETPDD